MVMKNKWLKKKRVGEAEKKGRVEEKEVISVMALGEKRVCEQVRVTGMKEWICNNFVNQKKAISKIRHQNWLQRSSQALFFVSWSLFLSINFVL